MNRTKIEWTDYTWNPVTGCWGPEGTAEKPNRCSYCYAQRVSNRFSPWEKTGCVPLPPLAWPSRPMSDNFQPLFWPDRLSQPAKVKKPSKIFVCSMADLFGDWVPHEWISLVLQAGPLRCPQHTFQFLTKNPARLLTFNPWPSNCWVGTTVTNQVDADERLPWLLQVDAPVRFVSHEPLLGAVDLTKPHGTIGDRGNWVLKQAFGDPRPLWACAVCDGTGYRETDPVTIPCRRCNGSGVGLDWAIIGAMTGPGAVRPDLNWTLDLIKQYQTAGVPIFCKDNLEMPVGMDRIQEWPIPQPPQVTPLEGKEE